MSNDVQISDAPPRSAGRGLFWLGILFCILGIAWAIVPMMVFGELATPWAMPVLTTIGAMCLLLSFAKRKSIFRFALLGLVAAFAAFQWYFVGWIAQLPLYEGPVEKGRMIPAFQTALANGSE